jgi:predicted DNA-binding WGR domain protein
MSFFRKLLGGKNGPENGRKARPPSPRPQPAGDVPLAVPQRQPLPSPEDIPPARRRLYLEYVGGASSKFYAISLEDETDGTWSVRFNFGRIGFPRAWDTRVEGVPWAKAFAAYEALLYEKQGKGYEPQIWPGYLKLPDGATLGPDDAVDVDGGSGGVLFRASRRGTLPPETGGSVAGVQLPVGVLYAPEPEAGSRGEAPVIWVSSAVMKDVGQAWSRLSAAFAETGIWPVVVDATYGFRGFDDYLMDMPRGRHTEVTAILRKGWNDSVNVDEEDPDDHVAPFGKQFPGLADRTPGDRPTSIDSIVATIEGHLGLVGVHRPADVLDAIGWMGAANYDGDPLDMSTVLRSWEARFDAYLVGLGTDTLTLAVGRPARDLASATAIAAEHLAFCPDNIDQGPGSIREYAPLLVNAPIWPFWWD